VSAADSAGVRVRRARGAQHSRRKRDPVCTGTGPDVCSAASFAHNYARES